MKINFKNRFCTERFGDLPVGATFRTSHIDTFFIKANESYAWCIQSSGDKPIITCVFEEKDVVIPIDVTIYISDQEAEE